MNKLQTINLAFFLFFFSFIIIGGERINESNTSKIVLQGEFEKGEIRSGGEPIEVVLQNNSLAVTFLRNLGNVRVSIINNSGDTVYDTTVNTQAWAPISVPLSGFSSGMYTITFSNSLGLMYGDFEL